MKNESRLHGHVLSKNTRRHLIKQCTILAALTALTVSPAFCASTEVIKLNNDGVRALNSQNFKTAISKFKAALAVDPTYARARENLGVACNNYALSLKKTPKEAIKYVHTALLVNSENKTTLENLDGFIKMLDCNPNSFDDRVKLGDTALSSNDFAGALIEYEAALKIKDSLDVRKKLATVKVPAEWQAIVDNKSKNETESRKRVVDEKTVDFGPYMASVQSKIKGNWYPPKGKKSRRAKAIFQVNRDGSIAKLRLSQSTGSDDADKAALKAVEKSAPFEVLPEGAPATVDIEFSFDYNVFNEDHKNLIADLQSAKESGNKHSIAIASIKLADSYYTDGIYYKAKPLYEDGIEILRGQKANITELADALMYLGHCYYSEDDYDKALEYYREAVAILTKDNSHTNELAEALEFEGHCYFCKDDGESATPIYKQSLEFYTKASGEGSHDYASAKWNVAKSLYLEGKTEEAIPFASEAYEIINSKYKDEDEDYWEVVLTLANCYWTDSQTQKALDLYKAILAEKEKTAKQNESELADRLKDVADCYYALDKKLDALPLYERALAIHRKQKELDTDAIEEEKERIAEISARQDAKEAKAKEQKAKQESSLLIERWLPWGLVGIVVGLLLVFMFERKNRESTTNGNPFNK